MIDQKIHCCVALPEPASEFPNVQANGFQRYIVDVTPVLSAPSRPIFLLVRVFEKIRCKHKWCFVDRTLSDARISTDKRVPGTAAERVAHRTKIPDSSFACHKSPSFALVHDSQLNHSFQYLCNNRFFRVGQQAWLGKIKHRTELNFYSFRRYDVPESNINLDGDRSLL